MRYGVLDVETSIYAKGNPFAARNRLCLIGLRLRDTTDPSFCEQHIWKIEFPTDGSVLPYGQSLYHCRRLIGTCSTIVVFAGKFDLSWLARYGLFLPSHVRVFDCQLAEFILSHQLTPWPSLDSCLAKYGLGNKSSVVHDEYWSKGIDTFDIPAEILVPYLETDLEKTDALYQRLLTLINVQKPLIELHMQDLRVLQEMEQNGLSVDWARMEQASSAVENKLNEAQELILREVPEEFRNFFNPDSGDHLSLLLYGGGIDVQIGTPYQHTYKGGAKAGTTELRQRWNSVHFTFQRLLDPPEGSELKKDGFFSTDEETLRSIRHASGKAGQHTGVLVEALLSRSKCEKLRSTYYEGFKKIRVKYDWLDNLLHGAYNQCRVITGRLSSEKPNLQNLPDEMSEFIISRYPCNTKNLTT